MLSVAQAQEATRRTLEPFPRNGEKRKCANLRRAAMRNAQALKLSRNQDRYLYQDINQGMVGNLKTQSYARKNKATNIIPFCVRKRPETTLPSTVSAVSCEGFLVIVFLYRAYPTPRMTLRTLYMSLALCEKIRSTD